MHLVRARLSRNLKIAALAGVFCLVARGPVMARVVRVGVYQNEPKIFVNEQGKAAGFFVEILEEIARMEGWRLEYVACEWAACLESLERGELDLMPDVAFTEERARVFEFGKVPVLYGWIQVYANPRQDLRSPLDLGGLRLAVLRGSVQEHALTNLLFAFGLQAELVRRDSFGDAFLAVSSDHADAVLANRFFGERHCERYGLKRTDIMFYPSPLFFAAPSGKNIELLEAIDKHVAKWKQEPSSIYYAALRRWLEAQPVFRISPKLRLLLYGAVAGLLLVCSAAGLLKWEVNLKTRELQAKNKQLEQALAELERLQQEAMRQERLHALGQMASGIAHDFNNVLSVILSYAEMVDETLKKGFPGEHTQEDLQTIICAAKDGAQIVRRMREFYATTESSYEMAPVPVNELVNSTLTLTQPRWDTQARSRGITIRKHVVLEEGPRIMGNEAELRQALINILINAIDAMPRGGDLIVRTKAREDLVIIEIEDSGEGMAPDVLANCTRPFFTTKGTKGTGLGLPMVVATVSRLGGRVDIQSEVGKGTCVRIELPAVCSDLQASGTAHQLIPIRPLKILLVDDDPVFVKAVSSLLVNEGHSVESVLRPLEALERICAGSYDVMLCDLAMPELSGLQLVELMRSRHCRVPVVMITGTLESLNNAAADMAGVIHFLAKPFSIQRLNKVFAALGFRAV